MQTIHVVSGREPKPNGRVAPLQSLRTYPQTRWQAAVKFAAALRRRGWVEARVDTYVLAQTQRFVEPYLV